MEDVVKQGTGTACQLDNMPVAGKTGTTEAYNDLWFVGYTPIIIAQYGPVMTTMRNYLIMRVTSTSFMEKGYDSYPWGLPSKEFEKPASVEKLSVCEETGLLPEPAVR